MYLIAGVGGGSGGVVLMAWWCCCWFGRVTWYLFGVNFQYVESELYFVTHVAGKVDCQIAARRCVSVNCSQVKAWIFDRVQGLSSQIL